jgi:hypothetical protein
MKGVVSSFLGFKKKSKKKRDAAAAAATGSTVEGNSSIADLSMSSIAESSFDNSNSRLDDSFDGNSGIITDNDGINNTSEKKSTAAQLPPLPSSTKHQPTIPHHYDDSSNKGIGIATKSTSSSSRSVHDKKEEEKENTPRRHQHKHSDIFDQLAASYTKIGQLEAQNDLLRLKLKLTIRNVDVLQETLQRIHTEQNPHHDTSISSMDMSHMSMLESDGVKQQPQHNKMSHQIPPRGTRIGSIDRITEEGRDGIACMEKVDEVERDREREQDNSDFLLAMPSPIYPSSPMTPGFSLMPGSMGMTPSLNTLTPMVLDPKYSMNDRLRETEMEREIQRERQMEHMNENAKEVEDIDESIERHTFSAVDMDSSLISLDEDTERERDRQREGSGAGQGRNMRERERLEESQGEINMSDFHDTSQGDFETHWSSSQEQDRENERDRLREKNGGMKSVQFSVDREKEREREELDSLATPSTMGSATLASTGGMGSRGGFSLSLSSTGSSRERDRETKRDGERERESDEKMSPINTFLLKTPEKGDRDRDRDREIDGSVIFYTPTTDPSVTKQLKAQIEELSTALINLKYGFQKR